MTVDKPRSKSHSWRRFATVTAVAASAVLVTAYAASGGASAAGGPAAGGSAGRSPASRASASQTTTLERAASERAASERAASDRAASDRAASDRAASDRAASERAASDRAASDRAASERATAGRAKAAGAAFRKVSYRGYTFEVPGSWRVIDLVGGQRTCVRFDRHVVYLGQPASNESCPSMLVGTTEAVLIQPAPRSTALSSVEDPVAKQITVTAPNIKVTATYDGHRAQIREILASASLPAPVAEMPDPAPVRAGSSEPRLSAKLGNYHGLGFDACTAPSAAYMSAWRGQSSYRAIGVYIGGSDRACAQPNLTAGWIRSLAGAGWHFLPMYVGPQAEFGQLGRHPGHQGRAAANDAVVQAERLGFGPGTPLYYDMEAYAPGQAHAALAFLSSWTTRLHELGYSSGVYGSSGAGIGYLAAQYSTHKYDLPDVVFDALWNGERNTADSVFGSGKWIDHRRVHQFAGNVVQSYGGDTIEIDQDWLNVRLPASASSARRTHHVVGQDAS
jgi:Domain of unknown function (DUF1906)